MGGGWWVFGGAGSADSTIKNLPSLSNLVYKTPLGSKPTPTPAPTHYICQDVRVCVRSIISFMPKWPVAFAVQVCACKCISAGHCCASVCVCSRASL